MEIGKAIANRGVERNKKPLKNIIYEIEIVSVSKMKNRIANSPERLIELEKYKFKDLGYLLMRWWYDAKNSVINMHGMITPDELKEKLGDKQWAKFCEGKRTFVIQRRVNGKNVKKKVKND